VTKPEQLGGILLKTELAVKEPLEKKKGKHHRLKAGRKRSPRRNHEIGRDTEATFFEDGGRRKGSSQEQDGDSSSEDASRRGKILKKKKKIKEFGPTAADKVLANRRKIEK